MVTSSDDAALTKTAGQIRQIEESAKQSASTFGDLAQKVAGYIGAFFGIQKIAGWFMEGTREFMAQDRALTQLSATAVQFGQDGKAAAEAAEALARRLENFGFNETEVIQATQRLTVVTKDSALALSAAGLAADVAAKTGQSYATALTIIQMLLTSSPRGLLMAQRQLGIEATSDAEALSKMNAMFRGGAEQMRDATAAASTFGATISEHWKGLGKTVASVWVPLAKFSNEYEKKQAEATIELEYMFKKMIGSTADADAWYATALEKWKEKFGIPLGKAMAKLTPMGDTGGDLDAKGKAIAASMANLQKDTDKAVSRIAKEDAEAQKQEEYRQQQQEWDFKTANAIKNVQDENKRVAAATVTATDQLNAKLLQSTRLYEAQRESIQKLAQSNFAKMTQEELKVALKAIQDELSAERASAFERMQLTTALAVVKKQVADNEAAAAKGTAEDAIKMSLGMFEHNKGVAAANALINTYDAANVALKSFPPPWSFIAAAAAIVAGLENVDAILSTDPGSGGGGGYGARGGAGSYATPMAAWQGRPSETSGGGGSVSTSTTYGGAHVTQINALTSEHAAAMMTDFQHRSQPAARARARGTVGYQAQQGGSTR